MSDEKLHLPVTYRSEDGTETKAKSAPVISGSLPEEMKLALETKNVCGECKYFSLAQGQKLMQAQRFVERLVQEDHWQVKHLASPLNDLGVCGAHTSGGKGEEEMITGKMHKSCDQFRPANGKIGR